MFRIAVCDDEKEDLNEIVSLLRRYDASNLLKITPFSVAKELLDVCEAETGAFDLAILDIEMEAPNGFEVAQRLLQQAKPPLIVFVTKSMAYTLRGYGIAFRYLVKPLDAVQFYSTMDAAVRELLANRFTFTVDSINYIVSMQEIYYFEVYKHYTTLHLKAEQFLIRSALKDVLAQLPSGYFAMPHQSYIVNLSHIKTASTTELYLTNGARIPISRRRQQNFKLQLYSYLGR